MLPGQLTLVHRTEWIGIADGLATDEDGASSLRVGMGVLLWIGVLRCDGLIGARYERDHRSDTAHDGTEREMAPLARVYGVSPSTHASAPGVAYDNFKFIHSFPRSIPARPLTSYVRCRGVETRCRPATRGVFAPPGGPGARTGDWTASVESNRPPPHKFTCRLRFLAVGFFSGGASRCRAVSSDCFRHVLFPARQSSGGMASLVARLAWRRALFGKVVSVVPRVQGASTNFPCIF